MFSWLSLDFILGLFFVCTYVFFLFFFFNDEEPQIHPTVAGFAFLFSLTSEVLTFWRGIIIFHLILVYSDERKAVFIPLTAERDGAHLCHPQPLYRTEVNAGWTLYERLFFLQGGCVRLGDPAAPPLVAGYS